MSSAREAAPRALWGTDEFLDSAGTTGKRTAHPHQVHATLPIRHGRFAPGLRKSSGAAPYSPLFAPSALAAMGLRPSVRAPGWDCSRGQGAMS